MIPMRTSTIFRSRWWALLWAAGIIWLAVDIAEASHEPDKDSASQQPALTDATGAPVSDEDLQKFSDALNSI